MAKREALAQRDLALILAAIIAHRDGVLEDVGMESKGEPRGLCPFIGRPTPARRCGAGVDEGRETRAHASDSALPEGILDALPFYVMLVDSSHTVLYTNQITQEVLGIAPAELEGAHCPTAVHDTSEPFPGCPLEEAAARPVAVEREVYDAEKGIWRQSAVYPTTFRSPAGLPVYVHIVQDIDARKRAERALRERVALEALISRLATQFLSVPPEILEAEIGHALRIVAEFLHCQRYAVYLLDEGGEHLVKTSEGQTPEATAEPPLPSRLPRDLLAELGSLDSVHEPEADVPEATPSAPRDSVEPTTALVPIVLGGAAFGFARFDSLCGTQSSRLRDPRVLKLLCSTLSVAFERSRAAREVSAYAEQMRSMALELSAAEERERRQLAADLHDSIGQTLALSLLKLSSLKWSGVPKELAQSLHEVHGHIEDALTCAKSLMFDLSPPVLHQLGLGAALEWLLEQCGSRHGLRCDLEHDGNALPLDDDHRIFLFRAVQELLTNVSRHARARAVRVRLGRVGDRVEVVVADDGVGMPAPAPRRSPHGAPRAFGLFSIRERLRHLGGSMEVDSSPGAGTRVTLTLPVSGHQQREAAP